MPVYPGFRRTLTFVPLFHSATATTPAWSPRDNLAAHSSVFHQQQWQEFALARRTLGDQIWQAKSARVWLRLEGQVGQSVYWLIWARSELTGEEKYFIAGGAAGVPLSIWLRVGFSRYNVEHCLRLVKSELGFRHFEGRSYIGLMRHMMLCLVTQGFAAGEAVSLRGENPDVTTEQVCTALNLICLLWLMAYRGTPALANLSATLFYRQRRNRAARESRQRRQAGLPAETMQAAARATRRQRRRNHRDQNQSQ